LEDSNTFTDEEDYDRRSLTPVLQTYDIVTCANLTFPAVYRPLSTARWEADNVLRLLDGWTDQQVSGRANLIAAAAAYSGYSHLLIGEGWCSAAFDLGPEQTRAQVFERAESRFTRAIDVAQTAGNTAILNLARLGRARTRLNRGMPTQASADAATIPPGFVFNATNSTASTRSQNHLADMVNVRGNYNVAPMYRTLAFQGVADPRPQVINSGRLTNDRSGQLWFSQKTAALDSPMPIARWEEAQLIVAEAQGGQAAVNIINAFHTKHNLPLFNSTDPAAIRAQIAYERRAELFLESHHLGDFIRYNFPLVPAAGAAYRRGGTYGSQICFPLHNTERNNNPNIGSGS